MQWSSSHEFLLTWRELSEYLFTKNGECCPYPIPGGGGGWIEISDIYEPFVHRLWDQSVNISLVMVTGSASDKPILMANTLLSLHPLEPPRATHIFVVGVFIYPGHKG